MAIETVGAGSVTGWPTGQLGWGRTGQGRLTTDRAPTKSVTVWRPLEAGVALWSRSPSAAASITTQWAPAKRGKKQHKRGSAAGHSHVSMPPYRAIHHAFFLSVYNLAPLAPSPRGQDKDQWGQIGGDLPGLLFATLVSSSRVRGTTRVVCSERSCKCRLLHVRISLCTGGNKGYLHVVRRHRPGRK